MTDKTNKGLQKTSAWFGVLAVALFFAGVIIAKFLPPIPPSLTAQEVSTLYMARAMQICLGGVIVIISGAFAVPYTAAVFLQLRRMEGAARPVGSYGLLGSGIVNAVFFMLPGLFFVVAGFRADRAVDAQYALSDLAMITFTLPWPPGAMMALMAGLVILQHGANNSAYPRWLGFFNIWMAIGMTVSSIIPFFKTGPFAWNGLIGFWLPASIFGNWIGVMAWMTVKAADKDDGLV